MVSDFIEECSNDYLEYDGEQACLLLETQTEGYFDSPKFLKQVSKAIDIFERKYPHAQGVSLLIMFHATGNAMKIPKIFLC